MSDGDSLGTWLDQRLAYVEHDLADRIRAAVPDNVRSVAATDGAHALAGVASSALGALIVGGCESRASAPALLVVDALVTYACEIAAEAGSDLAQDADFILHQIASVITDRDVTA